MDDFFSEGYIADQDENEEDVAEEEKDDNILGETDEDDDKEEMYSPNEDESFSEEI